MIVAVKDPRPTLGQALLLAVINALIVYAAAVGVNQVGSAAAGDPAKPQKLGEKREPFFKSWWRGDSGPPPA